MSSDAGKLLFGVAQEVVKPPEPEPEVVMIFPELIIPPPLQPPPKAFIRTTQIEEASVKPQNSIFESDRNTLAASKLPPKADGSAVMPTMEGKGVIQDDLINEDDRDGRVKEDSRKPPPANATALDMRAPAPMTPPSILKPQPAPPPPAQAPKPVAKADPLDDTPLKKMMEELDKESARLSTDRLPLEVRKPEPTDVTKAEMLKPQVRAPEDLPPMPPVPKAIPVPETAQASPSAPDRDTFTSFTRTKQTDGAISREGENAVNATATVKARYDSDVNEAIRQKWYRSFRLDREVASLRGRVKFRFYVDRRGVPQDLKILSDARDADPRMRDVTLRAILDADIPPIPDALLGELENGRIMCTFDAIVY
ncbi:MAG: hypothetical protein V4662_24365 [Verrucomicrobiota bacterium]